MTAPPLDSRVIRILRWLLEQTGPRSTADLGAGLGLGERVVRYRLDAVDAYLKAYGLELVRQQGSGLSVSGTPKQRKEVLTAISMIEGPARVYAKDERDQVLLSNLLWSAPHITSLDRIQEALEVSKASARRDLRRNEEWLDRRGLVLARRPGVGLSVAGSETQIRQALIQLTIEAIPNEVLTEVCVSGFEESESVQVRVTPGMRDHLARLPLQTSASVMFTDLFGDMLAEGDAELVFCVYLAVTAARLRDGRTIVMEPGQHRSLADHPVSVTANSIAEAFEHSFDTALPDLEIAGFTEYLLGLVALGASDSPEGSGTADLLDRMTAVAGHDLHEKLGSDAELRRSLAQHLERLSVRIRYGLPVHNPLLAEVTQRYPDVHRVATDLGHLMAEHFSRPISNDEIGFITMYLSGAMERGRLRPGKRAIVVCPSGMATAWVLVSRIRAEFPQLELTDVMSLREFRALADASADMVISTIEIEDDQIPVVVVSPLLSPSDVRRVAALA